MMTLPPVDPGTEPRGLLGRLVRCGNGLQYQSVALVFQTRAVDRRRVGDQIGVVSPELLAEIFAVLDRRLGR